MPQNHLKAGFTGMQSHCLISKAVLIVKLKVSGVTVNL